MNRAVVSGRLFGRLNGRPVDGAFAESFGDGAVAIIGGPRKDRSW
jgi:hypothetical protein